MASIVTVRNTSNEEPLKASALDITLEPGEDKEVDLERLSNLPGLIELNRTNRVEILLDDRSISAGDVSDLIWRILKQQTLLTMRLSMRKLHTKLARARTLFHLIQDGDELVEVQAWSDGLATQIQEVQTLLENDLPTRDLAENVARAIGTTKNDISRLEDYLVSRSRRPLRDWLGRKPDPLKPFKEDPENLIPDIVSRFGSITVRIDSLPDDDQEKALLKDRLDELSNALEKVTDAPGRADIAWANGRLKAIESRLPLPSPFLAMLAPILGVFTLQALIWWFAISGDIEIEQIWGMSHGLFLGVVLTGTLGSLARVLFRAINQEYRSYGSYLAIYMIGLVRPVLGAVMGLVVVLLFNSTLLPIPVSPGADGSAVIGPLPAELIFLLFAAFLAGFSDEWVLSLLPVPNRS